MLLRIEQEVRRTYWRRPASGFRRRIRRILGKLLLQRGRRISIDEVSLPNYWGNREVPYYAFLFHVIRILCERDPFLFPARVHRSLCFREKLQRKHLFNIFSQRKRYWVSLYKSVIAHLPVAALSMYINSDSKLTSSVNFSLIVATM